VSYCLLIATNGPGSVVDSSCVYVSWNAPISCGFSASSYSVQTGSTVTFYGSVSPDIGPTPHYANFMINYAQSGSVYGSGTSFTWSDTQYSAGSVTYCNYIGSNGGGSVVCSSCVTVTFYNPPTPQPTPNPTRNPTPVPTVCFNFIPLK
jgi:hypothetical protein